jgi:carbon-monoxide dehydrogenase large subunit
VFGAGTSGSRSMMMSGAALAQAADLVIRKGRLLAGEYLEASGADIEFRDGRFVVAGTDRSIGLLELAEKTSLDVAHVTDVITSAFPNGCHVAEVEIDPETGQTEVVRYSAMNDFGTIINPMIVEGQIHGGVMQGIGQALMESTCYDHTGQLLTGSFMDYALPRATDAPPMSVANHEVPATTNPLGVKGCGEAGCAGALTSVMNAVIDALSQLGIRRLDMPATPQRVWEAIRAASGDA